MDYGSGAVMSVPAHDSRDFAFATAEEVGIAVRDLERPRHHAYGFVAPDVFTDEIVSYLGERAKDGQPFLVYFPCALVHSPFVPTPRRTGNLTSKVSPDW